MDKFFEKYNLTKLIQEETKNLNSGVSSKYMEIVTECVPTKKTPSIDYFTGEFYKTLKEDNNTSVKETQNKEGEEILKLGDLFGASTTSRQRLDWYKIEPGHFRSILLKNVDAKKL